MDHTVKLFKTFLLLFAGLWLSACATRLSISSILAEYRPTMSSVPGFPLTVTLRGKNIPSEVVYHWKTEVGGFLHWSDQGVITPLGKECRTEHATLYWSPGQETPVTPSTFTITVEARTAADVVIGRKSIELVARPEGRYFIGG